MHLHKRVTVNRREASGHTELGAADEGLNGRNSRHSRNIVDWDNRSPSVFEIERVGAAPTSTAI